MVGGTATASTWTRGSQCSEGNSNSTGTAAEAEPKADSRVRGRATAAVWPSRTPARCTPRLSLIAAHAKSGCREWGEVAVQCSAVQCSGSSHRVAVLRPSYLSSPRLFLRESERLEPIVIERWLRRGDGQRGRRRCRSRCSRLVAERGQQRRRVGRVARPSALAAHGWHSGGSFGEGGGGWSRRRGQEVGTSEFSNTNHRQ